MDLERLEEILDQLSEITPGERDVRLAQLADGDAEFEREVSAVLAHYDAALRAESERAVEEIRDERYELLERLGAGAYGVVWLAQDRKLERKVALKIVRKLVSDSGVLKRVISEAQAVAATAEESGLERYVIGVHDIGRLGGDGPPYIAMEVLADDLKAVGDGRGLARSLRDDGVKLPGKPAYSMERSARIVAQAARGVASAHAREVVHRDVKPGNVLVTPTGRVAVVDFGLSVAVSADAAHERSEVDSSCSFEAAGVRVQGTAPYMAPEQARGGPADARSDVYALGATLYFLLTGWPPYRATGRHHPFPAEDVLAQLRAGESVTFPSGDTGRERELIAITRKAMRVDPADRYARAEDLALDLERWRVWRPSSVASHSLLYRTSLWRRRNVALANLGGLALVALGVLGLVLFVSSQDLGIERRSRAALEATARARQLLPTDPQAAVVEAVRSLALTRNAGLPDLAESEEALRAALGELRGRPLEGHTGRVFMSPDGRWLASGAAHTELIVGGLSGDSPPTRFSMERVPAARAWFTPDSRWLVAEGLDELVRRRPVDAAADVPWEIVARAPHLDRNASRWAVTVGDDVLLTDLSAEPAERGRHVLEYALPPGTTYWLAADESEVLFAEPDGTLRIWSLARGVPDGPRTVALGVSAPDPWAATPRGRWVELSCRHGHYLVDAAPRPQRSAPLQISDPSTTRRILDLAAGRWLLLEQDEQALVLWDLERSDPSGAERVLIREADRELNGGLSADGAWVLADLGDAPRGGRGGAGEPAPDVQLLWSTADVEFEMRVESTEELWGVAPSVSGKDLFLARGRAGEAIEVLHWSLTEGLPQADAPTTVLRDLGDGEAILDFSADPNGRWFALFGAERVVLTPQRRPGTRYETISRRFDGESGFAPERIGWLPNGELLLAEKRLDEWALWDPDGMGVEPAATAGGLLRAMDADGNWLLFDEPSERAPIAVWRPSGERFPRRVALPDLEPSERWRGTAMLPGTYLDVIAYGLPTTDLVLSGAEHDRLFRFGSDGSIEALRLPQAREVYLGLGGETALASTGRGGSFELWSAEGGGFRLRSLPGAPYGLQPSSLLRLAINDGLLAWSTWRGPLQMWDLTGEEPALAREIEGSPLSCTPSPDARWLAVNGRSGLYAYSTSSDARRELLARALDSETLAFSPDAGALVAHAKNLHARVWFTAAELTDWTESTLGLPADTAPSVTFSPSGQWMTTWSLTGLRLWRLAAPEGGRAFEPVAHLPDASSGHSYFASGAWLVTTSASGPVVAWELDTVAGTARPTELGTDGTLARATIAPDGTVVTLDREGGIRLVRRSAESWNLPGVELARLDDRVDVLRFLDGGERLLCAGDRVRVFTTDLDALVERSRDHLEKQHAETITELARDW